MDVGISYFDRDDDDEEFDDADEEDEDQSYLANSGGWTDLGQA